MNKKQRQQLRNSLDGIAHNLRCQSSARYKESRLLLKFAKELEGAIPLEKKRAKP